MIINTASDQTIRQSLELDLTLAGAAARRRIASGGPCQAFSKTASQSAVHGFR